MTTARYNVNISSNGRVIVAVDDFSFVRNEITFLFGESGIGKSMLCKAVYGLLEPDELQVTVNGMPYRQYLNTSETCGTRQSSFFVFQEPSSHLHPLMRISEQLREGSIAGTESEGPPLDPLDQLSQLTYAHRMACRHLMANDMVRGTRKVKLVRPDGSSEEEETRRGLVDAIAKATGACLTDTDIGIGIKRVVRRVPTLWVHSGLTLMSPTNRGQEDLSSTTRMHAQGCMHRVDGDGMERDNGNGR